MIVALINSRSRIGRPTGPGISGVTGTISDGSAITITGGDFGLGCANIEFEDFSGVVSAGDVITTSNSSFNEVSTSTIPSSSSDSRSGTRSMKPFMPSEADATSYNTGICKWTGLSSGFTEVFTCFAVKNPTGKRMTGITTGNNVYGSGSNWKTAWFLGNDGADTAATSKNDIVTPTLVGTKWSLTGNGIINLKEGLPGNNPTWWTFGEWNRLATWLKAGSDADIDAGSTYFEAMSESGTRYEYTDNSTSIFGLAVNRISVPTPNDYTVGETITGATSGATAVIASTSASWLTLEHGGSMDNETPVKFSSGEVINGGTSLESQTSDSAHTHEKPHNFLQCNIPGWMKPLDSDVETYAGDTEVLYDDIYLAYGDNAAARIELGNNADYDSCTIRAICDYSSWADGTISATVRGADLTLSGDTWLFLTKADNSTRYSMKVA